MHNIMTIFKGELADGRSSYSEQDGDINFCQELNGTFTLRTTSHEEEMEFESFDVLIEFLCDEFEVDTITICK